MDVRTLLRRSAEFHSAREAVTFRGQRLSFAEAWERGLQMANGLGSLGLRPGDRVAVLEENCAETVDLFLGAAAAGLVRVPLYARNRRESHAHMLNLTQCRAIVVNASLQHEIDGLIDELPHLQHILVRDEHYAEWLKSQSSQDPDPGIEPDDLYYIRFTGGTTGMPKGVPTTHRQFLCQGRDWFYTWPSVQPGDPVLHVAPISHASGLLMLPAWAAGGRNVIEPGFDPKVVLETMHNEKIAFMFLPPTAIRALSQDPAAEDREFPDLKVLMSAAAPIAEDTIRQARHAFGDVLYQGYGQSECFPLTMMGPEEWFADVPGSEPLRSCGRPLPLCDVAIWDADNNPLGPGEEGEIVGRCDGQIDFFWENPEETAERIVDGWMKTGDVGMLDANGYVYVLDRQHDMIISGGFNIYPNELENAISEHPAVVEAAVVGIPHEKWGETPLAVVVVRDQSEITEEEIIELVSQRLGSYKKPGAVTISTEPLPKTVVGKVDRKYIREPYWAGASRRVGGA
jgi:acyl-CoA synthetase (AMP-forming)/AMP-acid ligase II